MSLYIASLNSGSNGNCYYVGNDKEAILVDAGISCRETEKRMLRLGLNIHKVKAIFISHEHGDHISGLPNIAKKFSLPVYITERTFHHSRMNDIAHHAVFINSHQQVAIGDMVVTAFPKHHDAIDGHSFTVVHNNTCVGVFTDIGAPCKHLIGHFKQCHAAFLEANYDEDMLEQGRYPIHLKNRIRGGKGHLSNRQALDLFRTHRPKHMSHLLLSHLSRNNNRPELVQSMFDAHAKHTRIVVASRYAESAVYHVKATPDLSAKRQAATQLQFSFT